MTFMLNRTVFSVNNVIRKIMEIHYNVRSLFRNTAKNWLFILTLINRK